VIARLLIANRGEIACRIARTARTLGVTSIAVYSDADRNARHVRVCDEAHHLGAAAAADSYLSIPKLLDLARAVRADAIHPGYGFLSENADFAQACQDAAIRFVGPPAAAIRAMGSKSAAKSAMAAAGVPVAPGYHGDDQSEHRLMAEAQRVGFPLIIKASAGGGGKGMQVVHEAERLQEALRSAQRLARTAFGDDRLLMERYFGQARHVEVQVFADAQGNTVSLFDRDCSVQRRHQKIVEEAPAPNIRPEVRAAMADAAIRTARAVGYVGAGTVEFLLDETQAFYFMEMNTRLQVEHPVTEAITGLDLVEWQLRVAQGEALPASWQHLEMRGSAVEVRLYGEDPAENYLPSVGRIEHLRWPVGRAGLRLDVGVDAGDEVSSHYDPMLGKLIGWGASRAVALAELRRGLRELEIVGVRTNRALLLDIVNEPDFRAGGVATDYLFRHRDQLALGEPAPDDVDLAAAALWCATRCTARNALWDDTRGWRLGATATSAWRIDRRVVLLALVGMDRYQAELDSVRFCIGVLERSDTAMTLEFETPPGSAWRSSVRVVDQGRLLHLFRDGRHVSLAIGHSEDALLASGAVDQGSLLTPLPGTIVAVHVSVGQTVAAGTALVTVEAMKMEHTLTAPQAGTVSRLPFAVQDRVPAGAVLVEMAPPAGGAAP
jgi:3-methylcrotonyl-CoA carboxylase alpha subunit